MSWCHDIMLWRHKTWFIIYLSQLVDVRESRFFFFVSMVWWVNMFKNVINYLLVWGCDVTTSCHDVTNPDVPISACRCARKVILFCFYGFLGHWVWKCYWILFVQCCDVMTSYHDVTKPDLPISACRCPRKMIIFLFPCFLGDWVQNCQRFFIYMMSSCHDVMSWRHKVCFIYLGLWMG